MWGSMVVLIPGTGVSREAAAALARALDGVRFVVAERSLSADPYQCPAQAEAEAIARQLSAGLLADEVVIVGQGDGARVAVELARTLERPDEWNWGPAAGRISAVVVAGAQPPSGEEARGADPIAAPLHVWAGPEDLLASAGHGMLAWREFTDAPTTFRAFDGNGDFLLTRVHEVAGRLRRLLAARGASEELDVR